VTVETDQAGLVGVKITADIQDNVDAAESLDRNNQLFEFAEHTLNDPQAGYLETTRGKAAVDARDSAMDLIRKKHEALGKSLRTNTARALFERSSAGYLRDSQRAINNHAAKESRSYLAGSIVAANANRRVEWLYVNGMPNDPVPAPGHEPSAMREGEDTDAQGAPIISGPPGDDDIQGEPMARGPSKEERIAEVHALVVGGLKEYSELQGEHPAVAELRMREGLAELHQGQLEVLALKTDTTGTRRYIDRWVEEIPVAMREEYLAQASTQDHGSRAAAAEDKANGQAHRQALIYLKKQAGGDPSRAVGRALAALEDDYENLDNGMSHDTYGRIRKYIAEEGGDVEKRGVQDLADMAREVETSMRAWAADDAVEEGLPGGRRSRDWADENPALVKRMSATAEGQEMLTKLLTEEGKQLIAADHTRIMRWADTDPAQLRQITLDTMHSQYLVGQSDEHRKEMMAAWNTANGRASPLDSELLEGRALIVAMLNKGGLEPYKWAFIDRLPKTHTGKPGEIDELVLSALVRDLFSQPGLVTVQDQVDYLQNTVFNEDSWVLYNEEGDLVPRAVATVVGGTIKQNIRGEEVNVFAILPDVNAKIMSLLDDEDPADPTKRITLAQYKWRHKTLTENHQQQITRAWVEMGKPDTPRKVEDWFLNMQDTSQKRGASREDIEFGLPTELRSYIDKQRSLSPDGVFTRAPDEDAILHKKAARNEQIERQILRLQLSDKDIEKRIRHQEFLLREHLLRYVNAPTRQEARNNVGMRSGFWSASGAWVPMGGR